MAEQRADKEKTAFCQTNEELAVRAQAGDKGAILQLWNQTRGIIFMILARYYNRNPDRFTRCGVTMDDLEQEGFFAVLEVLLKPLRTMNQRTTRSENFWKNTAILTENPRNGFTMIFVIGATKTATKTGLPASGSQRLSMIKPEQSV